MTIDHLRVDHRVTVLRDFTDAAGITMRTGESGILHGLSWDSVRNELHIEIERASGRDTLRFSIKADAGPRNGHMREYFEVGEDVSTPRVVTAFRDPSIRTMIVPPPADEALLDSDSAWDRAARNLDGPDRLEDVEREMQQAMPYVGVGASIAELYAQRMRAFQRAGNEKRAIAAFTLAVDWMATNAGWATSGGEGAALSYESDQFRASLVREFGYDPTERDS